jgi:hypothetical protein
MIYVVAVIIEAENDVDLLKKALGELHTEDKIIIGSLDDVIEELEQKSLDEMCTGTGVTITVEKKN